MKFDSPLVPGRLVRRYKRFMADVQLQDGSIVTAHCANSGAMLGLLTPDSPVWLVSFPPESTRKLSYSWEIAQEGQTLVGVNTSLPNKIVAEALAQGLLPEFSGFPHVQREVRYGENSRIDFLLSDPQTNQRCYLEVKNVHFKQGASVLFPDAVTERGAKHLKELMAVRQQGHRAVMLYIVQRNDCQVFGLAEDIDFFYAQQARAARAQGVEFLAYSCHISLSEIRLDRTLPIHF